MDQTPTAAATAGRSATGCTARPLFVHCCHCRWCQRETGSAFVLNALIETDRVELLAGEPELVLTPSNSGKGQRIARCPVCRIALWSHYAGGGDLFRFVRVGTLDDPDRFPPDIHIFTSTKQPWVILPEACRRCRNTTTASATGRRKASPAARRCSGAEHRRGASRQTRLGRSPAVGRRRRLRRRGIAPGPRGRAPRIPRPSARSRPPRRSPRGGRPSRCRGSAASPGSPSASRRARSGPARRRAALAMLVEQRARPRQRPARERRPGHEADALGLRR